MSEEETDISKEINFNWQIKPPYHKLVLAVIQSIGWYVVAVSIVIIYAWPYIKKVYKRWKNNRDDVEYDAKYHKNIDLSAELLVATQLARERMQEKYLKDREIALKKEEERKERKRQELLRLQNSGSSGCRLNSNPSDNPGPSTSSTSKRRLKGEYNPLIGDGSGKYVPPKSSCCKKGGCG